jgi:hypothetical protein
MVEQGPEHFGGHITDTPATAPLSVQSANLYSPYGEGFIAHHRAALPALVRRITAEIR